MRRVVVIADESLEQRLTSEFIDRGASGFTAIPCRGAGRRHLGNGSARADDQARLEVIVTREVCDDILSFLRRSVMPDHHITACVETVDAVRAEQFEPTPPEERSAWVAARNGDTEKVVASR